MAVNTEFKTGRFVIVKNNTVTAISSNVISGIRASTGILLYSDVNNKGVIYIGAKDNVTADENNDTDGFPLYPGDSIELEIRAGDNNVLAYGIVDSKSKDSPWKLWFLLC